jgi:hypothetical protein
MTAHALDRRVYIIDDLLGAILLLAAAALAVLLDLTRRQICAVYQLAFALCGASAFFIIGGLVDHHLSNDQLHVALYGSYLSSSLTVSYVYLPTLASLGVSLVLGLSLSTCHCDCCCLVGATVTTHARCFRARIHSHLSLYSTCFLSLYVAIGTRLNVRLRESAINPVGGTVHWSLLRAPFYLAMAHVGSVLLVALKIFLQHADHTTAAGGRGYVARQETPTVVEEPMRPPPAKSFLLAPPRRTSGDTKHDVPRSAEPPALRMDPRAATPRSGFVATRARMSAGGNNHEDGDVSSLISSDSDSDDSALRPSFRTGNSSSSSATGKTLPPRHGSRKRSSGGSTSGYSSSPPSSPTRSSVWTGSSSFSASRPRAKLQARPGSSASSSGSSARPRLSSSSSTTLLSDSDDHALAHLEAYGASAFDDHSRAVGLRRRAPSLGSTYGVRRPSATSSSSSSSHTLYHETEWIECLDEASGSSYYYNPHTGESRWKDH